jgi:hypothetical protein
MPHLSFTITSPPVSSVRNGFGLTGCSAAILLVKSCSRPRSLTQARQPVAGQSLPPMRNPFR